MTNRAAKQRGIFERPRGSGIWWVDYRDTNKQRHREKVGRRKEAIVAYEARKRQVREGRFAPPKPDAELTFAKIAIERMKQRRHALAESSRETDRLRLGKLLKAFGELPAGSISAQKIDDFLAGLIDGGRTKSTANRYRSLLSSIFKVAVRNRRLATNPCVEVDRFKEGKGRMKFLSPLEEEVLRAAIRDICPERESEFDLALNTGMRRGEQFGLTRSGVDLERRILTVKGKTGQRYIVLNSTAKAAIETLLKRSTGEQVFPECKEPGQRDGRRWFEKCIRKCSDLAPGLKGFRWHDMRHTFASRLVMRGVDIRSVQELLGHKSIVMTMRYSHLSDEHQRANVEKLDS